MDMKQLIELMRQKKLEQEQGVVAPGGMPTPESLPTAPHRLNELPMPTGEAAEQTKEELLSGATDDPEKFMRLRKMLNYP